MSTQSGSASALSASRDESGPFCGGSTCSLHATFLSSSRRDAGKVARGDPRTRGDPWKAKHKAFAPRQGRGEPGCPAPLHESNTEFRSNCATVPRTSAEVRILYIVTGSRGARSTATPGYLPGVPPGRPRGEPFLPPYLEMFHNRSGGIRRSDFACKEQGKRSATPLCLAEDNEPREAADAANAGREAAAAVPIGRLACPGCSWVEYYQ